MANKLIVPTGTMSNLVGMWANIWDKDTLLRHVFIQGKADDGYYIVQFINAITGDLNVARIVHISEMLDWQLLPTKEIAEDVLIDYNHHRTNRFSINLVPSTTVD